VIPVCEALAAAHGAGVIHRDIKPDNIFISQSPEGEIVKLLDFGIAKLLDADEAKSVQTASAAFVGTPRYMSPERLSHSDYGEESDIYSVGVVIYEMVLGRAPWPGSPDVFSLVAQIVAGKVVPMVDLGVPEGLSAIVMRAISPDAAARLTALELAAELSALRGSLTTEQLEKVYGRRADMKDERTLTGPVATQPDTTQPETLIRGVGSREERALAETSEIRRADGAKDVLGRKG
jgi:serine/threonine protein kinase